MVVHCNELAACNGDAQKQSDNMMRSLHSYVETQMIFHYNIGEINYLRTLTGDFILIQQRTGV